MLKKIKSVIDSIAINLRDRREAKFTNAFHRELGSLRHSKMIDEAEGMQERAAINTIANSPKVQINTVKKAA